MQRLPDAFAALFANKLINDERYPIQLFESVFGYRVGLLAPESIFQAQIISLILLQVALLNILAILCWYGVIQQRQKRPLIANLVAWCILIPASLWLPVYAINTLDIRSKTLRFGCVTVPITATLKTTDALYETDSSERRCE